VLHDGSANAVYGHERLVTQQGATRTWYVGDALGSVRMTLDGAGAVQGTVGYDPWGTPQGDLLGAFGFTGALQDSASGLVHVRARWYDPGQSTFTSRDPFAGFPATPYSLHPYQYAYSNPALFTDPSGEIVPRGPVHSLACPPTYLLVDERCIRPTWLRWLPGPDEAPRNTPEEMERQAASQLVPVAGVAGVGGVRGGLGRAPQLGKAGVEACINAIGGLLILAGAQANVDVQTRRDDRQPIYLYHYTRVERIPLIIATGLRPSIRIPGAPKSDAQWGDGQYLTDLTPTESATVTRFQHSAALFKTPWMWGGNGKINVGWIRIDVRGLPVKRVAPLFGKRFPGRSIYLITSTVRLPLTNRVAGTGFIMFQPSRSGIR
jgi:RHS repeat-associated protein